MNPEKCNVCENKVSTEEKLENNGTCNECHLNGLIADLAKHMREAHITFEEMIRKIIEQVDK